MENLTLVIPAKYEKESLPSVLNELKNYNLNILIVLEEMIMKRENQLKILIVNYYFKNKGYGDALIQGIKSVETKYFVFLMPMDHLNQKN